MAENVFSLGCLLYAIMLKLPPAEGAIKFTLKPPNPSFTRNGSNAKLVWDYSLDNQAELNGIIYSVQVPGAASFTDMLGLQNDGTVITFSSIPNEYKGRVRIEGRASLVIENITSQDNSARFMCTLVAQAGAGRDIVSVVQLIVTAGQIKFTLMYDGKTITGLVGSSVNFTWIFSGDVDSVLWGLKKARVNVIKSGGVLVSLDKNGPVSITVPSEYSGRMSGSGNASSGQVTFTLSLIRMSDKGFYGCTIKPTDTFDQEQFDSVYLAVKGKSNALCPTDVSFILDSSNSIKDEDFNDEKEIVKKLVMNLDIAPDKNRAALVRFSTSPLLVARFGEYETAYKFQDVLEKLLKMGKRTRIDRALNLAENQIFPEARKGVNKMTIILTDGVQSTGAQGLRPSSKPLRDAGVRVIAVGVGVGKRERRLRLMTDRDEDVVDLKDVQRRLQEILDDISQNGCNQLPKPPAQKKCEDESVYEHECKKNIKIKSKNFCRDHPGFSFIHCQKSCDLCPLL